MLLTNRPPRARGARGTDCDRDDGIAMIAVIGLIAVLSIVTTLVVVSITTAIGFTSRSADSVQAQAAAEAGIAVARASLAAGACEPATTSSAEPHYRVAVEREVAPDAWQAGCPTPSQRVRITATGAATSTALASADGAGTVRIEAVLSAARGGTTPSLEGPVSSIYAIAGTGGSAGLIARAGETATVVVRTGDYTCNGGAIVGAPGTVNVLVADGDLTLGGSCRINGSVWVPNGTVTLPWSTAIQGDVYAAESLVMGGGTITGSAWVSGPAILTAAAIGGNLTAASVTADSTNAVMIGGSVVATGDVRIAGADTKRITGNVSAANLTLGSWSCSLDANAWVMNHTSFTGGDCRIAGTLTTRTVDGGAGRVGTLDLRPSPPASPYAVLPDPEPTPTVGPWVDYDYDPADWTGYQLRTVTGNAAVCNNLQAAIDALGGQRGVIDARGCANGITVGGGTQITMTNDVAIFATRFTLQGGASVASSAPVKLWVVVPDTVADSRPTCSPTRTTPSITGGVRFSSQVTVMLYSPCVPNLSVDITGTIYTETAGLGGNAKLTLSEIALPGLDVIAGSSSGTGPGTGTAPSEAAGRDVVLQRRVTDG